MNNTLKKYEKLESINIEMLDLYYQDEILPLIKTNNISVLNELPIFKEKNQSILFKDDFWNFKEILEDNKSINIKFVNKNTKLKNELKVITLSFLILHRNKVKNLRSFATSFKIIKDFFLFLEKNNEKTIANLNLNKIKEYLSLGLKIENVNFLNKILEIESFLPFNLDLDKKIWKSDLNLVSKEKEQNSVIPPRIYMDLMKHFSEDINFYFNNIKDLDINMKKLLNFEGEATNHLLSSIRTGKSEINKVLKNPEDFILALQEMDIPIVDNLQNDEWLKVFNIHRPDFKVSNTRYFKTRADNYTFRIKDKIYTRNAIKKMFSDIDNKCKYLCLALSGMRLDELFNISSTFGVQKTTSNGRDIYLFTTKQSKITETSQSKNDVFITTEVGYKAFEVLKVIHNPIRKKCIKNKNNMFTIISKIRHPKTMTPEGFGGDLRTFVNSYDAIDLKLNKEDFKHIGLSNPNQKKYNSVGDTFLFTPHQLRRSLAYYLIGYELLSFPQLKQQFSHYSMAMTRWYARNAHSFEKFYKEIENERTSQQSEVLSRIYNKLANKERVAGGKGKTILNEVVNTDNLYFKESVNNRKLSKLYWEKEIKEKRMHIHAIAPGMYCTNNKCSMRINIDLSECVDCEFDLIESATYAEASRQSAMKNILFAVEENELNSSLASKYVMQIRSAECIMKDLDFPYEEFELPKEVKSILIDIKTVEK